MDTVKGLFGYSPNSKWLLWTLIFVVLLGLPNGQITRYTAGLSYSCGGFLEMLDSSESGTISSPGYPSRYPNQARCIWLFEAPKGYAISFDLSGMLGEGTGLACTDFLEIRNGSSTSDLMYHECNSAVATNIQGFSRWFWVKFESDWTNRNFGFTANYSLVADPACTNLNFKCANKECISLAYRCDGDNDCGCSEERCDEIECDGLDLTETSKIGVGIGVGIGIFILVFIGVGLLEICLKKRAERNYEKQLADAKRRAKLKKAQNMAKNFLSNAAEGAKLHVPSIDLNASMSSTTSSVNREQY